LVFEQKNQMRRVLFLLYVFLLLISIFVVREVTRVISTVPLLLYAAVSAVNLVLVFLIKRNYVLGITTICVVFLSELTFVLKESELYYFLRDHMGLETDTELLNCWFILLAAELFLVSFFYGINSPYSLVLIICYLAGCYLVKRYSVQHGALVYTAGLACYELLIVNSKRSEKGFPLPLMPFLFLIQLYLMHFLQ